MDANANQGGGYACGNCRARFRNSHMRNKHEIECAIKTARLGKFKCALCDKPFVSRDDCEKHEVECARDTVKSWFETPNEPWNTSDADQFTVRVLTASLHTIARAFGYTFNATINGDVATINTSPAERHMLDMRLIKWEKV